MFEDMTLAERRAFSDYIAEEPTVLEQHIRSGGSVEGYLSGWRAARDRRAEARGDVVDPDTARAILNAPLGENSHWGGGTNRTVRDYLTELLAKFVIGDADPKYGMVGESDWEYDLFDVLYRLGLIPGWRHGYGVGYRLDGTDHPEDRKRAYALLGAAARALVAPAG